jgi:hypothetical protein
MNDVTIVNINRSLVKINKECGEKRVPVYSVHVPHVGIRYAYDIEMIGIVRCRNEPGSPLACGATVWMETTGVVTLMDEDGQAFAGYLFAEARGKNVTS